MQQHSTLLMCPSPANLLALHEPASTVSISEGADAPTQNSDSRGCGGYHSLIDPALKFL